VPTIVLGLIILTEPSAAAAAAAEMDCQLIGVLPIFVGTALGKKL
jgi:hypothetical protein